MSLLPESTVPQISRFPAHILRDRALDERKSAATFAPSHAASVEAPITLWPIVSSPGRRTTRQQRSALHLT